MTRTLSVAILLLFTASAFAVDRFNQDPNQTPIATTARIVKIDLKNRILKVRASDSQAVRNVPEIKESLWQRLGLKVPNVRVPGRIAISLPGHTVKNSAIANEYIVITADDTLFQDGVENLRLEDFRTGETISIHGVLIGSTLKASRIAKWD